MIKIEIELTIKTSFNFFIYKLIFIFIKNLLIYNFS